MQVFTENVFSALMRLLGGGKVRKEFRKIEKMTENDPSLKSELENLKLANDRLQEKIKIFCKQNPDHDFCNPNRKSKATIKPIYK